MGEAVGCSHHKIHEMLTSGKCPRDGSTLFDLAEWLGRQGSRPRLRGSDEDEERFFAELDALWAAAVTFTLLQPPELPPPTPPRQSAPDSSAEVPSRPAESPEPKPQLPFAAVEGKVIGDRTVSSQPSSGTRLLRHAAMPELMESRALLVATGSYGDVGLPDLPGVHKGARALADVLISSQPEPAFAADKLRLMIDPEDPRDILRAVQTAADEARDVLMLYFAGHGLVSQRGELQFATRSTEPGVDYTTVRYNDIRELVASSRAKRSLVVLDACYSGRALDVMGPYTGMQEAPSTYLLASAGARSASFVDSEGVPIFTQQLIDVLNFGDAEAPEILTIREIHQILAYRARRDGHPLPELRANETGHALALARNHALDPPRVDLP
ncbi:caspase family protein [Streptomyces turgidiscabies]|nr:caspase family protein [Streptomyces turgidiscabies]MDX3498335.1 caspase family protein [Streptomyces turgidiscabies]